MDLLMRLLDCIYLPGYTIGWKRENRSIVMKYKRRPKTKNSKKSISNVKPKRLIKSKSSAEPEKEKCKEEIPLQQEMCRGSK